MGFLTKPTGRDFADELAGWHTSRDNSVGSNAARNDAHDASEVVKITFSLEGSDEH